MTESTALTTLYILQKKKKKKVSEKAANYT